MIIAKELCGAQLLWRLWYCVFVSSQGAEGLQARAASRDRLTSALISS